MIEAKYLDQAIAQNLGQDNPDAMTCLRLAAQLIDRILLFGMPDYISKSGAAALGVALRAAPLPTAPIRETQAGAISLADAKDGTVNYPGRSEFARSIDGKKAADIWPIIEDVMSIMQVLHPDIYQESINAIKSK